MRGAEPERASLRGGETAIASAAAGSAHQHPRERVESEPDEGRGRKGGAELVLLRFGSDPGNPSERTSRDRSRELSELAEVASGRKQCRAALEAGPLRTRAGSR
jgi:hypothetical protein